MCKINENHVLLVRQPIGSSRRDNTGDFLSRRGVNEIGQVSLERRTRTSPKSDKSSRVRWASLANTSPPANKVNPKPDSKATASTDSRRDRYQAGPSRPPADTSPRHSDKRSPRASSPISRSQIETKLEHIELAQPGVDRDTDGARSGSVSPERPRSSDQDSKNLGTSVVIGGQSHIERMKNRAATEDAHNAAMESARNGLIAANRRAFVNASKGKIEPPRPAAQYQALADAKVEYRRSQRDLYLKTMIARAALQHGTAMDPATQLKFNQAGHALVKADDIAREFADSHAQAAMGAINEERYTDIPDHIKNDRKSVSRTNANKAFYGTSKIAQLDKLNWESVSKIKKSGDPNLPDAIAAAVQYRKEFKAAKEHYNMLYRHYQESREAFPDSSSSEDEYQVLR